MEAHISSVQISNPHRLTTQIGMLDTSANLSDSPPSNKFTRFLTLPSSLQISPKIHHRRLPSSAMAAAGNQQAQLIIANEAPFNPCTGWEGVEAEEWLTDGG